MAPNKPESHTFEKISNLYDKARVSYPQKLIDDIITYSQIKSGGKILDVGCGTGQATLLFAALSPKRVIAPYPPLYEMRLRISAKKNIFLGSGDNGAITHKKDSALFAKKGYFVVGLDPGKEMIAIAQQKCASFPKVSFKVGTFENAKFSDAFFDILASGMAWHWVNPINREEKVRKLLKKAGTLALFWNYQRNGESEFIMAVGKILDKYGREKKGMGGSKIKSFFIAICDKLKKDASFTGVTTKEYNQDFNFSKERYLDLVFSYGWIQLLSKAKKEHLKADLQELFKRYKEPLVIPYQYALVLAKKK